MGGEQADGELILEARRLRSTPYSCFVSHLECSRTGERYPADRLFNVSKAGAPLLVRYHVHAIEKAVSKADLRSRAPGMWRYREWLPLCASLKEVSLGEVQTPLIPLASSGHESRVHVKDEGRMPTSSFKARGLSVAVSMAQAFGVERIAIPSAGNAGAALAAYASRAGIESHVFCPRDAPEATLREIESYGARLQLVDGLIGECGEAIAANKDCIDWFDFATLKEPHRVEGKKTLGFELAEQMQWELPDVIFYPTGGGTGLIGMWKAFQELEQTGFIGPKRPRMVAVQSVGCAPLVKAFDEGRSEVDEPWDPVETHIHGVRVPKPFGDFLCLKVLYESRGFGSMVDDKEVNRARLELARQRGILLSPEGAACYVAYRDELERARISPEDSVILFNCAHGMKTSLLGFE